MKKTVLSTILVFVLLLSSTITIMAKPNQPIPYLDAGMTKSEFAVTLHNALDIHVAYFVAPDITDYYDDVKQDASYAMKLIDLTVLGIIDDKGSFKPNKILTREEMVHYIINAYKYKTGSAPTDINIGTLPFRDENNISPEYYTDVALAVNYGLISGYCNNTLLPKYRATYENVNDVITLFMTLIDKKDCTVIVKPTATINDDSIEMKLSIINNTQNPVTINHNSGQKFDFTLLDADRNVLYKWSADKMFTMALTNTVIEAGKSIEYSAILSGKEFEAIKDKVTYLKAYVVGSSINFNINAEGYEYNLK